jgi:hypothetical protein
MAAVHSAPLAALLALALGSACASSVVAVQDRAVADELALLPWRPASAADVPGHWRVRSLEGPAAAVLLDLAYWIDADGRFSGAALFVGPPPTYEVLSGTWTLSGAGELVLGADAEPARAEVAAAGTGTGWLRLSGAEGSLVLERAEIR